MRVVAGKYVSTEWASRKSIANPTDILHLPTTPAASVHATDNDTHQLYKTVEHGIEEP